eukprot:m.359345 g.359345  ORF g.359345 m.359345 type:complete len:979 (+) comp18539_c0_seq1:118-3054(+)
MSWKNLYRFCFFENQPVVKSDGSPFEELQGFDVTCHASGRGLLLFGGADGHMLIVDKAFNVSAFRAFQGPLTQLFQLKQSSIVVAVGEEEVQNQHDVAEKHSYVRMFNVEKVPSGGAPSTYRQIICPVPAPTVTAIAAHENLKYMVFGTQHGELYITTGDISRERRLVSRGFKRFKGRLDSSSVTGLGFNLVSPEPMFYACTVHHIYGCYPDREITERLSTEPTSPDRPAHGASPQCSAVSDVDGSLWVDGSEDISMYLVEGRGSSIPFEGIKTVVQCFNSYLVVVHYLPRDVDDFGAGQSQYPLAQTVTICDPKNKFVAFDAAFQDVSTVLMEWNSLFVLSKSGKLTRLTEKDLQTKLDNLCGRKAFDTAISLAKSQIERQDAMEDILTDIYMQYAEHLYSKKSFDTAIKQYINTIGRLEPSYVIRKFLDSQRIHNLTEYLQELHSRQLADRNHTTLLLNCYTKLRNVDKLNEFIMTDAKLNFDLETALKVCRQAGYYEHALFLARRYCMHDWYLKIQLEDTHNAQDALDYIQCLPFSEAVKSMQDYGKLLVTAIPEASTELLKHLCTSYTPQPSTSEVVVIPRSRVREQSIEEPADPNLFIHLFVDQPDNLVEFLQYMIEQRESCSMAVYDTLIELYLQQTPLTDNDKRMRDARVMAILAMPGKYNEHQAMIMAQMYDFKPGLLLLYERKHHSPMILLYYIEKKAYTDVIETCKRYEDKALWAQALEFFAGDAEGSRLHLADVLTEIRTNNILSPLMVIDVLAKNDTVTLSSVKDYFMQMLGSESTSLSSAEQRIQSETAKTDKLQHDITDLRTKAKLFQDTRCAHCHEPLSLPAVHFLCGHSYHKHHAVARPDSDGEVECMECQGDHAKVAQVIGTQIRGARDHEQFTRQLEDNPNRFGVIAQHFSQNLFRKPPKLPQRLQQQQRELHLEPEVPEVAAQSLFAPSFSASTGSSSGGFRSMDTTWGMSQQIGNAGF